MYPDDSETDDQTYEYVQSTATRGPLLVRALGLQTTQRSVSGYDSYVQTLELNAERLAADFLGYL